MDGTADLTARMARLEARHDWLDEHGTRAVNVLALQVSELTKDFGELKGSVESAMIQLREARRLRWSNVLMFIGIMLPQWILVAGLLVTLKGLR